MEAMKTLEDLLAKSVTFETSEQKSEALVRDCELFTDAMCAIIQRWAPDLNSGEIKLTPGQLTRTTMAAMKLKSLDGILDSLDRIVPSE